MTKVTGAFRNFGTARKKTARGIIGRKVKMSGDCGGQDQTKSTFTITLTRASVDLRSSAKFRTPSPPHSGLSTPAVTTTCILSLSSGQNVHLSHPRWHVCECALFYLRPETFWLQPLSTSPRPARLQRWRVQYVCVILILPPNNGKSFVMSTIRLTLHT
jgi:hypothetical protein